MWNAIRRFLERLGGAEPLAPHLRLGRDGERAACRHLKKQGYKIVDRNVELAGDEIDIVAMEGKTLCFIEVKTRRRETDGFRTDSNLTPAKKAHVVRAARLYVKRRRLYRMPRRYDFVGVVLTDGARPQVTLIRDAWRPSR